MDKKLEQQVMTKLREARRGIKEVLSETPGAVLEVDTNGEVVLRYYPLGTTKCMGELKLFL